MEVGERSVDIFVTQNLERKIKTNFLFNTSNMFGFVQVGYQMSEFLSSGFL